MPKGSFETFDEYATVALCFSMLSTRDWKTCVTKSTIMYLEIPQWRHGVGYQIACLLTVNVYICALLVAYIKKA